MDSAWPPQFVFAACQCGAESSLKKQIGERMARLRPAFSRPGFVTFKLEAPCAEPENFQLPSPLARAFGFCLGKVSGDDVEALADSVWQLPAVEECLEELNIDDLHVWQRDTALPGDNDIEPGPTAATEQAEEALRQRSPLAKLSGPGVADGPSRRNRWVLDVILIEPNQWWVGCHRTTRRSDCWPGGVPPLQLPEHAVSRAYLKMQEALEWSALPMTTDDVCLEIGCAPGGASQALLDCGLTVIGVDPAEVEPQVLSHHRFSHIRRRAVQVPRKHLKGVHWLATDMNVAPAYTLDVVEAMVTHRDAAIRGMILTLKLADWSVLDELPAFLERIRKWGYHDLRVRQLAFNRQEICVVALRSKGQRRMLRQSRRRRRLDSTHKQPKQPHLPSS